MIQPPVLLWLSTAAHGTIQEVGGGLSDSCSYLIQLFPNIIISSYTEVRIYHVTVSYFSRDISETVEALKSVLSHMIASLHTKKDSLWMDVTVKCVPPHYLPVWEGNAVERENEKWIFPLLSKKAGDTAQLPQWCLVSWELLSNSAAAVWCWHLSEDGFCAVGKWWCNKWLWR